MKKIFNRFCAWLRAFEYKQIKQMNAKAMPVKEPRNTYTTTIYALDPIDGQFKHFQGPYIKADNWTKAEKHLQENGLGYCKIEGRLIREDEYFMEFERPSLN